MAPAVASYARRQPEKTALYRCLQEHLATFIAQAEAVDRSLPKFVRREFEAYLSCGILANGFARVHCEGCGYDRFVAFSCKKRGFCPSCGGRRMAETAAHLVDCVIPEVPVRQWVLSLPPPLRYLLAYDSKLCSALLNIFIGEVFRWLRRTAKAELGLDRVTHAYPGAVTVIQRFGSALNLNIHLHALIPDGVFVQTRDDEQPVFRALRAASKGELLNIAWSTCRRTLALLKKRGLWLEEESAGADTFAEDEPLLAQCYAASIYGTLLLAEGKRSIRFMGADPRAAGDKAPANGYGFDVDASVRVRAHDRERLERLCRYIARPPLANDRLEELPDGRFSLRLKRPWDDGTTHLIFDGVELIGRLVALVPPPRTHQIRFHGVFAPHAKLRSRIVPQLELGRCEHDAGVDDDGSGPAAKLRPASQRAWAELMKRVFAIDVLECPRCHSTMQRIASIMMPAAIRAILTSVGQPMAPPELRPARLAG